MEFRKFLCALLMESELRSSCGNVMEGSLYPLICQTSYRLTATETEISTVGSKRSPVTSSEEKQMMVVTW